MSPNEFVGYDLIINEIPEGARVLDLGCGNGDLLALLVEKKKIEPHGIEISQSGVKECVKKGLFVSQSDIDDGLSIYKANSFDYVIINQTLQNTKRPEFVMKEIMRIGKHAIVSFPNFVYIQIRLQMMFKGAMPTTRVLPFAWYESPNIHLVSIKDFTRYCHDLGYPIKKVFHFRQGANEKPKVIRFLPNLFAEYSFFVLDGIKFSSRMKKKDEN
ncbi:MAG TPA: methionine biosynthesis protein MetW [Spirochaetota bacterium]